MTLDVIFGLMTILMIFIGVWAATLLAGTSRIMLCVLTCGRKFRSKDFIEFGLLATIIISAFIVVFWHPGLIYKISSTLAVLELAAIPILAYFTEHMFKDWAQIKQLRAQHDKLHAKKHQHLHH